MEVDDVLEHHGIKGQKWGIRHDPKTGRVTGDHRRVAELRKKPVSSLTNNQLKVANERLNLEQNFRRLNPTTVQKGHNTVKSILATAGTVTAIVGLATKAASILGKRSLQKKGLKIATSRTFT